MSKLLPLVLLLCGCAQAGDDMRPFVAVAGKYALLSQPKPAPAPSGVCSNCRGLGYLTDGTVRSECPVCKGTGKPLASVLIQAPAPANCKDGTCPKPTSR